ncbi:MAG: hypothetical protein JWR26_4414 [Pedosphaera sp.]|nr:hypothetical protein [Pedosphaera sp.]
MISPLDTPFFAAILSRSVYSGVFQPLPGRMGRATEI